MLEQIYNGVIAGNSYEVTQSIDAALNNGIALNDIVKKGLIAAMEEVGHRFEKGDTYIPEMMIAAHAMQAGLEIIRPQMEQEEFKPIAIVILGTVKGDMHDIGKNLVGMFMKGVGFDVIDLGVDVEPSKFVEAINEHDADILCMSALLTTTMLNMTEVIKVLTEAGIRDKVNIMVGGAPITSNFANEIGADSYAADAASAARFAKELVV